ncbi:MAG: prepilin-type N-terminal cleavage/methylation domain-containing protein [Gemmatimonadetes bacterium]|nr:prepilin-type N-terminal cleavage/methylation domain-containing protein [Gemmatimonadota bacterium]
MFGSELGNIRDEAGFSLVELVMAVVVLAFGVVGLATTTLFITRQLTLAEVTTARVTAIQSVMERIRTTPYDSICEGTDTMGAIIVSWSETAHMAQTKAIRIVTMGPGLVSMSGGQSTPMMSSTVADTVVYRMLKP